MRVVFLIVFYLGIVIAGHYFRKQAGMDRFKKLVSLGSFASMAGFIFVLMSLFYAGRIDVFDWYGELTDEGAELMFEFFLAMMLCVGGMSGCFSNLLKYIEEIRNTTYALARQAEPSGERTQIAKVETEPAPESAEPIANKIKMRDVHNGWKCICCGQANKDDEQQCVECGTKRYEPRTAVDDARQAKIINSQIACPVCGIMQGMFRSACRNCKTKFVSTEAQARYLAEKETTWQCQFCDQENTGSMEYCAFCGVERKTTTW